MRQLTMKKGRHSSTSLKIRKGETDSKDEVFNLRRSMKKISKKNETLTKEMSKLKRSLKKPENELTAFKSSQDDFIESLHSLHNMKREKNHDKAFSFLCKSSEGGNMNASYLLGLLYEKRESLDQSFKRPKLFYDNVFFFIIEIKYRTIVRIRNVYFNSVWFFLLLFFFFYFFFFLIPQFFKY